MFILEESQLLEDTIKDQSVLKIYQALKRIELGNDRVALIDEILETDKSQLLLKFSLETYKLNGQSIEQPADKDVKFTRDQIEQLLNSINLEKDDVAALALVISAALNLLFVIDNYVGPSTADTLDQAYSRISEPLASLRKTVNDRSLCTHDCEVYHLILNPWLLRTTQLMWTLMNSLGCSRKLLHLEFLVWKHRYMTTHFMQLLEPTEFIINELRKVQECIFDHHVINESASNKTQLVRFNMVELCCELIQSSLLRDAISFSRKFFDYASELSGLEIEHTGVLGKRTRFQQKDIPQLVVRVKQRSNERPDQDINESHHESGLPVDVKLDDDTLLPDIAFVTKGDGDEPEDVEQCLNQESQLLMITKLDMVLKTEVMEETLKDEWTLAYLRSITKSATMWAVKYKALAARSIVERKHTRRMDRSLTQMDELIKSDGKVSDKKMKSFFAVLPLSKWQMRKTLGDISIELGLFKNALDLYTQIEFWEGVIKCHNALGQTVKAEKVIRQELQKQETPYLYCLLGDALDSVEFYEKSWALSNQRFARAKKSIGTYYYVRKDYENAIKNYELAHSVNPSNVSILSLLSYSCLTLELYDKAAEYYRKLTYIDDGNFLAWNNLSKAYIKLDQKERAWRTLREALKCNYEEWKVWENFMLVSIQIGALDDVIIAWHRLIDIKSSHSDDQILNALTHALVMRPLRDVDANHMKLLSDALKLVARLVSTSGCSPRTWINQFKLLIKDYELSTKLKPDGLSKLDENALISKITNALQRSTPTSLAAKPDWFQRPDEVVKILDSYCELANCYVFALKKIGPRQELDKQWKYFKMSYTNATKTLESKGYKCAP